MLPTTYKRANVVVFTGEVSKKSKSAFWTIEENKLKT
jgi:hypothetical protein